MRHDIGRAIEEAESR